MAITRKPLSANFRVTNMDDETIGRWQNIRPGISQLQAEMFLQAVSSIRNAQVGNGYLTINSELRPSE